MEIMFCGSLNPFSLSFPYSVDLSCPPEANPCSLDETRSSAFTESVFVESVTMLRTGKPMIPREYSAWILGRDATSSGSSSGTLSREMSSKTSTGL